LTNAELKERLSEAITLLQVPGVGAGRYKKLIKAFGGPGAVLSQPLSRLEEINGISRKTASDIQRHADAQKARAVAAEIIQLGWSALFLEDDDYPVLLKEINDPPPILYRLGLPMDPQEKMIAVVGTRHATEKGRLTAGQLAADLAESGIAVVSGMAEGIDTAAHRGCLNKSGHTVAVWGTSLDRVFPACNKGLAEEIRNRGTIYSEYLPQTRPDKTTFPERNRIISGLCAGTVVVEAGTKSGALITAELAASQGREVFAVPGHPKDRMSIGANDLIRNGACLTTSIDDIFSELPGLKGTILARKFTQLPDMTPAERDITNRLANGAQQLDQLSRAVGLPVDQMMELLLALELKGVIRELAGKRYVLTDGYE